MDMFIILSLIIMGAAMGSFAGASVWRLRATQLQEDKEAGEKVNKNEYAKLKKLTDKKFTSDRSVCLNCSYQLRWYDLIPIVSWLSLRGRCRMCRAFIGYTEILIELGMASFFVISYIFWPLPLVEVLDIVRFMIWLLAGVGLAILFIYDLKWYLLPDKIAIPLIIIGMINAVVVLVSSSDLLVTFMNIVGSLLVLSGLYLAIYLVSKGQWIGFGDVKLGLVLGLMLADWQLALVGLFMANLVGCVFVMPLMVVGKLTRNSKVPFGPMLVIGYFLAGLFGSLIISELFLLPL